MKKNKKFKINTIEKSTLSKVLSYGVTLFFYIILISLSVIGFYILITIIQEKIFTNGEYITYMIKSPYSRLIFVILTLVMASIGAVFTKNRKAIKYTIPFVIVLIYMALTSVIVVTNDGIIDYSFYNLKGNRYEFSDVEYVDTGFINRGRNKGEFFYNIKLNNSKKFKLAFPSMPQPGRQYYHNTWSEYIDIDKKIMDTGAKKESSEKGSKYVSMDKIYVDKLLSVVRNK